MGANMGANKKVPKADQRPTYPVIVKGQSFALLAMSTRPINRLHSPIVRKVCHRARKDMQSSSVPELYIGVTQ